ncbi:ABC transporter permease [Streptomyces griseoaurantiacus]|uniref:ABC transporter permease n=1 Tax=Streptomyces griseoaurantiacus TaxID=68213 RepID=A0A7W2DXJ1_9ACTN|nr:ABC transporter permease [Streptomyces griseoaurantiacus]MBA5224869.1 ABC transporter permease [Streptomyces griseoaurantiacus]GHE58675.1 ABC transporter permease [Streptomyces griseoaurantiacus]
MLRLIGNRIATSIPLLLIVTLIVFVLQAFVPGDAARTILGENANPQTVAALREQLGLNEPLVSRYGDWLAGALHGDLGTSIISGVDVMSSLDTRLGVTLSLLVPSMLLSAVAGIALGFASAVRGGFLGRVIDVVSLLGFALPSFWIALLLVAALAERANLLPATGYTPFAESPGDWLRSIVLPVIALSLHGITAVAKQTRDSVAEVLEADYVRFLRANGVGTTSLLLRHVLRNAAIPVVTSLGLVSIGMLSGAVFIENVFVLPGLGTLATQATLDHDVPVILGVGVVLTLAVIVVNLLIDIAYGLLNPKVRAA